MKEEEKKEINHDMLANRAGDYADRDIKPTMQRFSDGRLKFFNAFPEHEAEQLKEAYETVQKSLTDLYSLLKQIEMVHDRRRKGL